MQKQVNSETCIDGIFLIFRNVTDVYSKQHTTVIKTITDTMGPGWIGHTMIFFTRGNFWDLSKYVKV